jgi:SAM-dependent methyltransferase
MLEQFSYSTYGDSIAEVYDAWHGTRVDYEQAAQTLSDLARGGRVLELGIGTGLFAIPLARRGVRVEGVDTSPAMISRLRQKPGGAAIPVAVGDCCRIPLEGPFSLVYAPFNFVFGLLTQDEQKQLFERIASWLVPDGSFLVEIDLEGGGEKIGVLHLEVDRVALQIAAPLGDNVVGGTNVELRSDGVRFYPWKMRLAAIGELDLMAERAGLRCVHRWRGWNRAPLTGGRSHITVYSR